MRPVRTEPDRAHLRTPSVVVDVPFALSPMGLLVTMMLARTTDVWLPRGFYTLLDNDAYYRLRPDQIGGQWLPARVRAGVIEDLARELEPWRRAWQNGRLSSRVHWIGDAQFESVLPDRLEIGLLPRFESCCAALDARLGEAGHEAPLDTCARDIVALSAALQPGSTYILAALDPESRQPALGSYLGLLGFPLRALPGSIVDWRVADFGDALAPIAADGRGAAFVQIVAPQILSLPDRWDDSEWVLEEAGSGTDAPDDPWRSACALWSRLVSLEVAA